MWPPLGGGATSSTVDHLVYGVRDLAASIDEWERATGVRPALGGRHPGFGTHNALVSLGDVYLELLAPDPEAAEVTGLGTLIAGLAAPRLVTFAARTAAAAEVTSAAAELGLGVEARAGSRRTAAGELVEWRNVMVSGHGFGTLVPFFIEWAPGTPHPAATSPPGGSLEALWATHPEAGDLASLYGDLGIAGVRAEPGPPALHARLATPAGELTLG